LLQDILTFLRNLIVRGLINVVRLVIGLMVTFGDDLVYGQATSFSIRENLAEAEVQDGNCEVRIGSHGPISNNGSVFKNVLLLSLYFDFVVK